ncbi:hypothetical protein ACFLV7_06775, partial [Chloroflexota bacterium]
AGQRASSLSKIAQPRQAVNMGSRIQSYHAGNKNSLSDLQCCLSKAQSTTMGINRSSDNLTSSSLWATDYKKYSKDIKILPTFRSQMWFNFLIRK